MTVRPLRRPLVAAVFVLTGVAVLALVAARAALVPLTFDEVVTFERTIDADPLAVFDFRTATNHLLNTLLTRASHAALGSDAWALRLPSVAAALGYLLALGALAARLRHGGIAAAGVVVLATNLYVLDFFALSRGYGLALCFLTAALYGLVRWIDTPDDETWLGRALGAATLAVVANFAVLPALIGVIGVVLVRRVVDRGRTAPPAPHRPVWIAAILILGASAVYSLLVFSRDRTLSADLYEPITVRILGLVDDELADVFVFAEDVRNDPRALERTADGTWRTGGSRGTVSLKIDLPKAHERNLAAVEVSMGGRVFRRTRLDEGPWTGYDWNGRRVLRSTEALSLPRSALPGIRPMINWRGDRGHWTLAAAYTGAVLAGLAALWALLEAFGRPAVARGWLPDVERGWLTWTLLAVAGLCAAPLYLLQRNRELYFGGVSGLIPDTLGSLATASRYAHEVPLDAAYGLAWTGVLLILATALASLPRHWRPYLAAPLAIGGVGVVAVIVVGLQHHLLRSPYPLGRTALYFWPIAGVWLWLLTDALASLGRPARLIATTGATLLAAASAWHAATAANLTRTFDDYADAAVPAMVGAVAEEVRAMRRPPPFVRLGVEWSVLPVTRYYASRLELPRTKVLVHTVPNDEVEADYVYVLSRNLASGEPVREFPVGRGVLYRVAMPASRPAP